MQETILSSMLETMHFSKSDLKNICHITKSTKAATPKWRLLETSMRLNLLPLFLLLLQENFESFEIFGLTDSKSFYF